MGGIGHYNAALLQAYTKAGHDVFVVERDARTRTGRLFGAAFNHKRRRLVRGAAYAAAMGATFGRAHEYRAESLVVHFLHWPLVDYLVLALHRFLGRKVILVAHDPIPMGGRKPTRFYRLPTGSPTSWWCMG